MVAFNGTHVLFQLCRFCHAGIAPHKPQLSNALPAGCTAAGCHCGSPSGGCTAAPCQCCLQSPRLVRYETAPCTLCLQQQHKSSRSSLINRQQEALSALAINKQELRACGCRAEGGQLCRSGTAGDILEAPAAQSEADCQKAGNGNCVASSR